MVLSQLIPADLHAAAYCAVQICAAVKNLSLTIVSFIWFLVTATGVRISDGICYPAEGVLLVSNPAGTGLPWASGTAAFAASCASVVAAL